MDLYSDRDPTPTNSTMNNGNGFNNDGGRGGLGASIPPNGTAAIGSEMAQMKMQQENMHLRQQMQQMQQQMQQQLNNAANQQIPPQNVTPAHAVVEDVPHHEAEDSKKSGPTPGGQDLSDICFHRWTGTTLKAWDKTKKKAGG